MTCIEEYMRWLPTEKIPRLGTEGERYRDRQVVYQLPRQDMCLAYTRHVEAEHRRSFEDFVKARNEIASDFAIVKHPIPTSTKCPECGEIVKAGTLGVIAPKFGESVAWHPSCFVCSVCKELLVDLAYCLYDDHIYCERHYAEQLRPRCAACDEVRPISCFPSELLTSPPLAQMSCMPRWSKSPLSLLYT
ncbi:unnamed protein product [Darwinula stevensoni]|uniref:Uncharacterized protein n=1 Tax=Darwinula stevensoni TaxID=69355 RepID=A0A7R8X7Q7_9CRUS|nr:unnamed protein product [Darwinula stevensoni]CAG0880763.1 unnamed protein product [Darwinula stevensoni]